MKYRAIVGQDEYLVKVDPSGEVHVDGCQQSIRLESIDQGGFFMLLAGAVPHEVFIERRREGYAVTVEGYHHLVHVVDESSWFAGERDQAPAGEKEERVISPMPGIVVAMLVEEGQPVRAGDGIAILEAMKMENEIRARRAGVVRSVHVRPGQTVNLNDVIACIDLPENTPVEQNGEST
ncbi:MAG: biotin/lipoyl-binding protein [Anaerolineae bacterium]|nr:biotin/lipoyl-binding protein [Anaerolineae bacterium]